MAYDKLRVAQIIQETPDARSFVLEVPAALGERYRYRAGQFLTFRVPHPDGAFNRCYSLSSAPEIDGQPKVLSTFFGEKAGLPDDGIDGTKVGLLTGGGTPAFDDLTFG